MSHTLALISCSNVKLRGGEAVYRTADSIVSHLPEHTRQGILRTRNTIRELISQGFVEDRLRGDGNRLDSRYNLDIAFGPDMGDMGGADDVQIPYLPAYRRYDGRFFFMPGRTPWRRRFCRSGTR